MVLNENDVVTDYGQFHKYELQLWKIIKATINLIRQYNTLDLNAICNKSRKYTTNIYTYPVKKRNKFHMYGRVLSHSTRDGQNM